jgi:glyoxylase-like metal-dependent hydrolase (beta-lactamase superfamily II)
MSLTELAEGVFAWLAEDPGPGRPNAGVVVEDDGVTVIDSLMVPSQARPFAAAVEALGRPVRRLVLTSSHLEYAGGTPFFPRPAVYGTGQISAHLDQPPDVGVLRRLYPGQAAELDEELRTRPVTHVVTERTKLTSAVHAVLVLGDLEENLVLAVPRCGVVFGGATCSFGVTPLAFQTDPTAWADTCADVAALGPTIVPGHGPLGGADDLLAQSAYLYACADAAGDPSAIPAGPWDRWSARENDEVNVERAAMLAAGSTDIPPSMLRRAGLA